MTNLIIFKYNSFFQVKMAPSPSIQINKNLDAILILAGEYKSGRSELTHQIYTQIMETGRDENPLFVVVSGKKSGFNGTESKVSESQSVGCWLYSHLKRNILLITMSQWFI